MNPVDPPGAAPPPISNAPEPPREGRSVIDRLIRGGDALLAELDGTAGERLLAVLAAIALVGHLVYGLVVGSFSGGTQWWAAPAKVLAGTLLCALICFPSLYIFACFSGADVSVRRVVGMLLALFALTGVFLAGFTPVTWVFSQSSTLVSFVGAIHLTVWSLSVLVSSRILFGSLRRWKARNPGVVGTWVLILLVTCAQMMTALRPIVGTSSRFLDPEKRFFLQHWFETMGEDMRKDGPPRR